MMVRRVNAQTFWWVVVLVLFAGLAAACHNGTSTTAITVSVTSTCSGITLPLQGTCQFSASVLNATDTTVTWQVNMVTGGTTTCGIISTNGLYTAPSVLPTGSACGTITITAVSNQDTKATGSGTVTLTSGITVTIAPTGSLTLGTNETLSFVATVSGAGTGFVNTVNWLVDGVEGGNSASGNGTITPMTPGDGVTPAVYVAPSTVPASFITIEAQSVADTTQVTSVDVTIVTASPPTLTSVSPNLVPQGAVFEDLYLTGTNFLSTTTVTFAGLPVSDVTRVSDTSLRARVSSSVLAAANTNCLTVPATNPVEYACTVVASSQGGATTAGQTVTVAPVRPAALTALPSTFVQQSGGSPIIVDGGYYLPSSTLAYNGTTKASSLVTNPTTNLPDPRGITAVVGGISNDLTVAGLYQVEVNTPSAVPTRAALDVAVRPTASPTKYGISAGPGQLSAPVAVAVNDVTGAAVVVNQGNNTLALLDPALTTVSGTPVAVGTMPTAVAVDSLKNLAFVTDTGSNDLAVVDLSVPSLVATLPCVGTAPVAVGIDEVHGRALVVNQNGGTATLLDTTQPMNCPATVGITSITRTGGTVVATLAATLAVPGGNGTGLVTVSGVADSSFNGSFVVVSGSGSATLTWAQAGTDASSNGGSASTNGSVLGTVAVTTGAKPQVTVLTELGWAIVTPGGSGSITVVDLIRNQVVFTAFIGATIQGMGLDTETKTLLFADPSSRAAELFRLTDQSVGGLNLGFGNTSAAVNALTRIGVVLNPGAQSAFVIDMATPSQLPSVVLGNNQLASLAVAFAQGANKALITDDLDNSVTVLDFGPTRASGGAPQILEMSCPAAPPAVTEGCPTVIVSGTAAAPVPLTIVGAGFSPNAQIRLEEAGSPVVTTTRVSAQLLTATIPVSFLNGGPRRIVVDVEDTSTGALSNVKNIYLTQAVPVGQAPTGVAVDQQRDIALVANTSDNTVSEVDLNPSSPTFATVTSTVTVGAAPVSVAVLFSAGRAVVADSGESTAALLDLTSNPPILLFRVPMGAQPAGVAVDQGEGTALVTSSGSNILSTFPMAGSTAPQPSATSAGSMPVAVAVAPDLEVAVVASETGNSVQIFNTAGVPVLLNQIGSVQQPVGVDYDPVNQVFLVAERAGNAVLVIDPINLITSSIRTGVDPSSLAYNYQSSTLLTLNTASNTLSVVDLMQSTVVDVLPLSGSSQYALAIHPRLSMVVVSDSINNRVLLMPMPR